MPISLLSIVAKDQLGLVYGGAGVADTGSVGKTFIKVGTQLLVLGAMRLTVNYIYQQII